MQLNYILISFRCDTFYYGNPQVTGGTCTKCDCHGNSNSCNILTGVCEVCEHNTVGLNCERCMVGFFGNASQQNCAGKPTDISWLSFRISPERCVVACKSGSSVYAWQINIVQSYGLYVMGERLDLNATRWRNRFQVYFQPVLHDWYNKGRGMCYPVCGMVHIKEPLLLIGKSRLCGGSGFPHALWMVLYHMSDAI